MKTTSSLPFARPRRWSLTSRLTGRCSWPLAGSRVKFSRRCGSARSLGRDVPRPGSNDGGARFSVEQIFLGGSSGAADKQGGGTGARGGTVQSLERPGCAGSGTGKNGNQGRGGRRAATLEACNGSLHQQRRCLVLPLGIRKAAWPAGERAIRFRQGEKIRLRSDGAGGESVPLGDWRWSRGRGGARPPAGRKMGPGGRDIEIPGQAFAAAELCEQGCQGPQRAAGGPQCRPLQGGKCSRLD